MTRELQHFNEAKTHANQQKVLEGRVYQKYASQHLKRRNVSLVAVLFTSSTSICSSANPVNFANKVKNAAVMEAKVRVVKKPKIRKYARESSQKGRPRFKQKEGDPRWRRGRPGRLTVVRPAPFRVRFYPVNK